MQIQGQRDLLVLQGLSRALR